MINLKNQIRCCCKLCPFDRSRGLWGKCSCFACSSGRLFDVRVPRDELYTEWPRCWSQRKQHWTYATKSQEFSLSDLYLPRNTLLLDFSWSSDTLLLQVMPFQVFGLTPPSQEAKSFFSIWTRITGGVTGFTNHRDTKPPFFFIDQHVRL